MNTFEVVYKIHEKGDKTKSTIGYIMRSNSQVIAVDIYKGLELAGKGFVVGGTVGRINNRSVIVRSKDNSKEINGRRITEDRAKVLINVLDNLSKRQA